MLMAVGNSLSATISDRMRIIWHDRVNPAPLSGLMHDSIYKFRTSAIYQWILNVGKRHVVPFLLAVAIVWFGATLLSHFLFNAADSMGAFCQGTAADKLVAVDTGVPQDAADFNTTAICAPTGLKVRTGFKYEIAITMTDPWEDGERTVTPVGYRTSTIERSKRWRGYATIFLRRILFRPWYRLNARVGETGVDEYFLDPAPVPSTDPQVYKARFTADRSGEIFLFVNEAVLGLPWLSNWFYRDHKGKAKVTVKLL
ncbi:hypothetical protein MTX20_09000 [Bradyrhizobium sp. ISRA435]|nr:hypothetical protein MTX20_09000 [Bradyrhizobium sp. ISRA435]